MLAKAAEAIEKYDGIAQRFETIVSQIGALFKDMESDKDQTLADQLIFFHLTEELHKKLDATRKGLYAILDGWDKGFLPKRFEDLGQELTRVPALGRSFYPQDKFTASIVAERKSEAYEWLRSHDASDLITETVNAGTLSTFIRSMALEQNVEPPSELFKMNSYKTIGSSKYTVKADKAKKASAPA